MAYDNASPAQGHQALSDIDVIRANTNELRKFEASPSTAPPSNPVGGQFWWTTDTTSLYQRNQANTSWTFLWSEANLPANEVELAAHIANNITSAVTVHGIRQGSGNGLDADKLDGNEASAFLGASHGTVSSGVHGSGSSILLHLPTNVPILIIASGAPTGWTQNTSYNDRVIRIVSGAGGGQGGSWTISGLAAEAAHTHSHSHSLATIGSDIQVDLPNHPAANVGIWTIDTPATQDRIHAGAYTNEATGNPSRKHSRLTTTVATAGSSHNHASDASWRPLYLDVIAVTKNA